MLFAALLAIVVLTALALALQIHWLFVVAVLSILVWLAGVLATALRGQRAEWW
jgi:hypothetical protein